MCLFRSEEVKKEFIFTLRWRVEKRMYLYVFEVVKKRMYFAAEWKVEKRMYLYEFEVVGKECILLLSGEYREGCICMSLTLQLWKVKNVFVCVWSSVRKYWKIVFEPPLICRQEVNVVGKNVYQVSRSDKGLALFDVCECFRKEL